MRKIINLVVNSKLDQISQTLWDSMNEVQTSGLFLMKISLKVLPVKNEKTIQENYPILYISPYKILRNILKALEGRKKEQS